MRYLFFALPFAVLAYGQEFALPIPTGGNLIIQHPQFIRIDRRFQELNVVTYDPMLTFSVVDKSSAPWKELKVQFDIGGICNGEVRQWTETVLLSFSTITFMAEQGMKNYDQPINSLTGKVQGCNTEIIKVRVGDPPVEALDLKPELEALRLKRESEKAAENAARVEKDRVAAEDRAKRDAEREKQNAADAARRKRLADEQKKKDAEQDAIIAKARAEEDAKAAEKVRQVRAACALIYKNTANTKISDLTVKEEQQVQACQALDLYPPR